MQPVNRTKEPLAIGDLFAANIFGNDRLTNYKVNQIAKSKPQKTVKLRTKKSIFETDSNSTPLTAYLPMLDKQSIAMSMDNYRLDVAQKNIAIEAINQEVEKYNALVEIFCTGELDEVQKTFPALFLKKIKTDENRRKYEPQEYNALVETFNNERGLLIKKRKETTIKYGSEIVFQNFLHIYSKQLSKRTTEYMKLGISQLTNVPPIEINSYHITALERANDTETFVYSLPVCNATVRNHRIKLEKVGILTNYKFQGHTKGVKMHISPKILVLFDVKTGKYTNTDNQEVNHQTCKKFTDKNKELQELSITVDKRENRKSDFLFKGTATPDLSFVFYKNIPAQDEKSKLGAREKSVKVSKTLSEKLQDATLSDTNLAKRLAAGEFHAHKRIEKVYLYEVANHGTLTKEEFYEAIRNEFFKNLSKIYRQSTPFAGTYQKAMEQFEDRFTYNNGNGKQLVHKATMVDILQRYLWMVNYAHRWFTKTGVRPLNPHDYLDRTRTHKKEIGFDYLEKAYAKHLKTIENNPLKAKKAAKNAELRKTAINHNKIYDQKLTACSNNRISVDEFIDFVDKHLPPAYLQKASDDLIKKYAQNQIKYDC